MYTLCERHMRRISVLLEEDEYLLFEAYCKEFGHKKSTLVSKLIRDLLDRERVGSQRPLFELEDWKKKTGW